MTTFPNWRVAKALSLGAEIERCVLGNEWAWRYGLRSSADQYCRTFASQAAAAEHFLASREGIEAMRRRLSRGNAISR